VRDVVVEGGEVFVAEVLLLEVGGEVEEALDEHVFAVLDELLGGGLRGRWRGLAGRRGDLAGDDGEVPDSEEVEAHDGVWLWTICSCAAVL
jgi:hypothetical protein